MGDHIVKSLHEAIQLSLADENTIKTKDMIDKIAEKFKVKMEECVASLSQPSQS